MISDSTGYKLRSVRQTLSILSPALHDFKKYPRLEPAGPGSALHDAQLRLLLLFLR
jgi:hypothetical protein